MSKHPLAFNIEDPVHFIGLIVVMIMLLGRTTNRHLGMRLSINSQQ